MPIYTVTHDKAGVNAANTIMWQLRAAAASRLELVELGISVTTAPTVGPAWRLNRPTAVGATFTSVTPQTEDDIADVPAAAARLDHVMGTLPTLAATDMRKYATPSAIGSGIVWTWYNKPLRVAPSLSVAVVNGNATSTTLGLFTIYAVFFE